jgi:hypothetical protein
MGDSTNMVLILGGELLKQAEHLLIMGLVPSEVIKGYELASVKALGELESAYFIYVLVRSNLAKDDQSSPHLTSRRLLHRILSHRH